MEKFRDKILYSTIGAFSGLAGLTYLIRCSGATCASCLGCAIPGAGILILTMLKKLKKRSQDNGMA